jgi:N utilization substance protein B
VIGAGRRADRERALLLAYEADLRSLEPSRVLAERPVRQSPFVVALLGELERRRREIDGLLEPALVDWRLERLPVVDRALLRLAVAELLGDLGAPPAVVLAEAVSLAQRFSTEDSGRFVNGVLATIALRLGCLAPSETATSPPAVR